MNSARIFLLCIVCALALRCGIAAAAIQATDDRGKQVVLAAPAMRIVALAPHVTELVFAAGAGDKLVGATAYSDYPAAAKNIPQVGDYAKIDLEKVALLKPDLVIAWQSGNHPGDIEKLERLGIPVYVTEPRQLEDIPRLLSAIGVLAGSGAKSEMAAISFNQELAALRQRYSGRRLVSVFFEIWHAPLMTLSGKHMISHVIELCGGRNIFAQASMLAPTVAVENVLTANPEVIIASGAIYTHAELMQMWQSHPQLTAVQKRQIFLVNPDIIQRTTPRILQGAQLICRQLEQARGAFK